MRQTFVIGLGLITGVLVASAQHFPPLDRGNSRETRTVRRDSYCMTAGKSFPADSAAPLMTCKFQAPGASGSVLLDRKTIKVFKNEQQLRIYAKVSRGNHQFSLILTRPATLTFMASNDDFKYCQP